MSDETHDVAHGGTLEKRLTEVETRLKEELRYDPFVPEAHQYRVFLETLQTNFEKHSMWLLFAGGTAAIAFGGWIHHQTTSVVKQVDELKRTTISSIQDEVRDAQKEARSELEKMVDAKVIESKAIQREKEAVRQSFKEEYLATTSKRFSYVLTEVRAHIASLNADLQRQQGDSRIIEWEGAARFLQSEYAGALVSGRLSSQRRDALSLLADGVLAAAEDDWASAEKFFKSAAGADPSCLEARVFLARVLSQGLDYQGKGLWSDPARARQVHQILREARLSPYARRVLHPQTQEWVPENLELRRAKMTELLLTPDSREGVDRAIAEAKREHKRSAYEDPRTERRLYNYLWYKLRDAGEDPATRAQAMDQALCMFGNERLRGGALNSYLWVACHWNVGGDGKLYTLKRGNKNHREIRQIEALLAEAKGGPENPGAPEQDHKSTVRGQFAHNPYVLNTIAEAEYALGRHREAQRDARLAAREAAFHAPGILPVLVDRLPFVGLKPKDLDDYVLPPTGK